MKIKKRLISIISILLLLGLTGGMMKSQVFGMELSIGQQGEAVAQLQAQLMAAGYYYGTIDGDFGDYTSAAVQSFQADHGLYVDGIVGPYTYEVLLSVTGQSSYSPPDPDPEIPADDTLSGDPPVPDADPEIPADDTLSGDPPVPDTDPEIPTDDTLSGAPLVPDTVPEAAGYSDDFSLSYGDSGEAVAALQQALKDLGYLESVVDGIFGYATESAVLAFQQTNGLYVDGIAGPVTRNAIIGNGDIQPIQPTIEFTPMAYGSTGDQVLLLQERLQELGYLDSLADGVFGRHTQASLMAFQLDYGLYADGVAGELTWSALQNADPDSLPYASPLLNTYVVDETKRIFQSITDETMTPVEKLETCFEYVGDRNTYYYSQDRIPYYTKENWPLLYASDMLYLKHSDCHGFAGLFGYLAAQCGYSDQICWCATESGGHSWVEIDGLVYDPVLLGSSALPVRIFGATYEEGRQTGLGEGYADTSDSPENIQFIRVPEF